MRSRVILRETVKQSTQEFMLVEIVLLLDSISKELYISLSKMVYSGYSEMYIQELYNQLVYNSIFRLFGIVHPEGLVQDVLAYQEICLSLEDVSSH